VGVGFCTGSKGRWIRVAMLYQSCDESLTEALPWRDTIDVRGKGNVLFLSCDCLVKLPKGLLRNPAS